jgi:hypothetical protein
VGVDDALRADVDLVTVAVEIGDVAALANSHVYVKNFCQKKKKKKKLSTANSGNLVDRSELEARLKLVEKEGKSRLKRCEIEIHRLQRRVEALEKDKDKDKGVVKDKDKDDHHSNLDKKRRGPSRSQRSPPLHAPTSIAHLYGPGDLVGSPGAGQISVASRAIANFPIIATTLSDLVHSAPFRSLTEAVSIGCPGCLVSIGSPEIIIGDGTNPGVGMISALLTTSTRSAPVTVAALECVGGPMLRDLMETSGRAPPVRMGALEAVARETVASTADAVSFVFKMMAGLARRTRRKTNQPQGSDAHNPVVVLVGKEGVKFRDQVVIVVFFGPTRAANPAMSALTAVWRSLERGAASPPFRDHPLSEWLRPWYQSDRTFTLASMAKSDPDEAIATMRRAGKLELYE